MNYSSFFLVMYYIDKTLTNKNEDKLNFRRPSLGIVLSLRSYTSTFLA